jgi:hypothetical protein
VLTEYLARKVFGTDAMPSYKVVFIALAHADLAGGSTSVAPA